MGDAEKDQYDVVNSGGPVDEDAVRRFISLVKVFSVLLAALSEGGLSRHNQYSILGLSLLFRLTSASSKPL